MLVLLSLLAVSFTSTAQDDLQFETVDLIADDGTMLIGDYHVPVGADDMELPAVLLMHMFNSNRSAYDPIIQTLVESGYVVLNVDLRGHGDSGGSRDWDLAIDDVQLWIYWLREQEAVQDLSVSIVGASVGSNLAIIGCANDADCVTAIALSPGIDYFGLRPEASVINGLSERSVLLVASHDDRTSANAIRQMFRNATGDVVARMYMGGAHGTQLFDNELTSVTNLILNWLDEQTVLE